MPEVHEHCKRLLNYDAERNVVVCSKCKAEWWPLLQTVPPPDAPTIEVVAVVSTPTSPKRGRSRRA